MLTYGNSVIGILAVQLGLFVSLPHLSEALIQVSPLLHTGFDKYIEVSGTNEKQSPMKGLNMIAGIPPKIATNEKDDIAVPVEGIVKFADLASKRFGSANRFSHLIWSFVSITLLL